MKIMGILLAVAGGMTLLSKMIMTNPDAFAIGATIGVIASLVARRDI
ncbi:hypothetical protein [Burkholderia gladioli]|nr:hypothetical protein [Burkholderia gladioli]